MNTCQLPALQQLKDGPTQRRAMGQVLGKVREAYQNSLRDINKALASPVTLRSPWPGQQQAVVEAAPIAQKAPDAAQRLWIPALPAPLPAGPGRPLQGSQSVPWYLCTHDRALSR